MCAQRRPTALRSYMGACVYKDLCPLAATSAGCRELDLSPGHYSPAPVVYVYTEEMTLCGYV